MRRIITTAVLGLTLLGAAACADTTDTATPGASSSAAASPSAAAGTTDKAATCADVKKLEEEVTAKGTAAIAKLLSSMNDQAKSKAALDEIVALVTEASGKAEKIAADATDPELKAALTEFVAENKQTLDSIKAAGTDVSKAVEAFGADSEKAEAKLTALCG
jgi:hypothetical protein